MGRTLSSKALPGQRGSEISHQISHPGHNLVVLAGKGVAIPSSGERPEPFPKWLLLGMVCVGVYIIHP